jgi:hypothetical protein
MQKEFFESNRPPPPVIKFRCYDVLDGIPVSCVCAQNGRIIGFFFTSIPQEQTQNQTPDDNRSQYYYYM